MKLQRMFENLAIADAAGASYEFLSDTLFDYAKAFDLRQYKQHPNPEYTVVPGYYTDDTQMSLAVAKTLLDDNFTGHNLVKNILFEFKQNPINGYSRRFQRFLEETQTAEDFLANIKNDGVTNGSVMSALPLGALPTTNDVLDAATIVAKLRHDTPNGIEATQFIALASHYHLYELGPKQNMYDFASQNFVHFKEYFDQVNKLTERDMEIIVGNKWQNKGVPCDAIKTAGAVLYLYNTHRNQESTLSEAILMGGDTDSTASIACGLCSFLDNTELPQHLQRDFAPDQFGLPYIKDVAKKVEEKFKL